MGAIQRMDFLQADNQMRTFAKESGGMAFFPRFYGELPEIFQSITEAMRNQYVLTYTPSNQARDGKFRKIKVELINPENQRAAARGGRKGQADQVSDRRQDWLHRAARSRVAVAVQKSRKVKNSISPVLRPLQIALTQHVTRLLLFRCFLTMPVRNSSPASAHASILLVDDNANGLSARKTVLEELGHRIATAAERR